MRQINCLHYQLIIVFILNLIASFTVIYCNNLSTSTLSQLLTSSSLASSTLSPFLLSKMTFTRSRSPSSVNFDPSSSSSSSSAISSVNGSLNSVDSYRVSRDNLTFQSTINDSHNNGDNVLIGYHIADDRQTKGTVNDLTNGSDINMKSGTTMFINNYDDNNQLINNETMNGKWEKIISRMKRARGRGRNQGFGSEDRAKAQSAGKSSALSLYSNCNYHYNHLNFINMNVKYQKLTTLATVISLILL